MAELIDVFNAFPDPLKAGWALWLAWGAAQMIWFRRGRAAVAPALPAPRPRPRRVPKPPVVATDVAGDQAVPMEPPAAASDPIAASAN